MANETTIDSLVNQIISKSNMTNERIEALKKKIRPHSSVSELKEILNNIILEDVDYIRKYLKNTSNIAFQQDFIINKKENFIYRADFNNDSADLNLHNGKVMLAYKDYTLNSHNFEFIIEVFINGRKINNTDFFERPSDKEYNFITGGRRIFINEQLVSDGDIISVVVRKFRKMKSYYKYFKIIDENQKTYQFKETDIGNYGNNFSNLMVFRKLNNGNSFLPYSSNDYYFESDGNIINITFTGENSNEIKNDDYFLIMNKTRINEVTFINNNELNETEYVENDAIMTLDIVDRTKSIANCYLPLAIRSIEELEIYVDGYRLVDNKDFTFVNDEEGKNQYVQFAGILKQGSVVTFRNKNIGDYGFYNYISNIDINGIINLSEYHVPIDEFYVEAYLGRRRVPLINKRNIINNFLKIDNQHSLLYNECYTEINNDDYTNELLNKLEIDKYILGQLQNLFPEETKEAWIENNPVLPNDDNLDEDYLENEIFLGKINRIQLIADSTIITEGRNTEFTVIGYYGENEIGIDVTKLCSINGFNPFSLGIQVVKATFKQGNILLEDTIKLEIIPKEIIEIKIITDSNFYVLGDSVLDTIRVLARFEDNSTKYITEDCEIDAPEVATEVGSIVVTVNYNYNRQQLSTTKVLLVSETADRYIDKLEILTSTVITDNDEFATKLELFATFNNNLVQKLSPDCLTINVVDGDNREEITDIENVILPLNNYINLEIKAYTTNSKENTIYFINNDGDFVETYETSIKVLNNTLISNNKTVIFEDLICHLNENYRFANYENKYRVKDFKTGVYITIGIENVRNDSICFANMENNQLVIVEVYNSSDEFIEELLFVAKNKNINRGIIDGSLLGDPFNGFIVKVNQFILGMNLSEITFNNIKVIDNNDNEIAKFDSTNIDSISYSENSIYFNFNDYSTQEGNIKKIADSIINNNENENFELYLDIPSSLNLIKLAITPFTFNIIEPTNIFFDRREDDYYLKIVLNQISNDNIRNIYESRPYNSKLVDHNDNSNIIKLPTNILNYILVNESRYGINRYFIQDKDDNIYVLDININMINGRVIFNKINNTEYTEEQYDSIEIIKI